MRINHNMMAMNAHRALNLNSVLQTKSLEKLSSGLRINRAADDAAGLSISEKMRGQIRGLAQAARNAQDGISFLQTAEGAMDEVSSMLVRMKELTIQKASGTYNDDDIANIELELEQLNTQINDIITTTEFNGKTINNSITVCVTDDDTVTTTLGSATAIESLAGVAALVGATADTITTAMVEAAVTDINTVRSTFGAQQNRLESVVNNVNSTVENLQSAESRIRDTDMASEMAEFNKYNILLQASTAMLAQANAAPNTILQLLR